MRILRRDSTIRSFTATRMKSSKLNLNDPLTRQGLSRLWIALTCIGTAAIIAGGEGIDGDEIAGMVGSAHPTENYGRDSEIAPTWTRNW